MEKLLMCRICLAENVRMHVVVNRNLHELYEKLTYIPFVTEDNRPLLACFFCYAKLKQCYRLLRQCLEAEEQFAQMMNEDYELNPLINQDQEFCSGFIKSPIVYISINDECQTESIDIKEELPAAYEGLDDIIEPKEERQSDELEPNLDNSCLDVAGIPPRHSESDLEDVKPVMEFKIEVEEEVSEKKRRASETNWTTVAKKQKLDTTRIKLEDAITAEQSNKETTNSKGIITGTTDAKKRKQDTRRIKLEDAITAEHTTKEKSNSIVMRTTQKRTSKPDTNLKKIIHPRTQISEKPNCAVSKRSFNKNCDLTKDIRIHTVEKPYKCDVCERSFSDKGDLRKHIRIHTGEKPYKCDVCQRSFNVKSNFTQHTRIHTGEKPHKCVVCQHSFNHKSNLTDHMRKHTGEKPHKCDVCQRSFSIKSNLKNHMRIHTGQKPHKCDICQRSFSEKGSLTRHIRIHVVAKS